MFAVILVAGRETRMGDLTLDTPKPMLELVGKPKLAHSIEQLPDAITDVVLVIGYLGNIISDHFGSTYAGKNIHYVKQTILNGTDGAIRVCEQVLKGQEKFLVLNGDDMYHKDDLQRMLKYPYALLAEYSYEAKAFALVSIDEEDNLESLIEKSDKHSEGLVNTGAYMLGQDYFKTTPVWGTETETWLPHTLLSMKDKYPARVVHATAWMPIGNPEQYESAKRNLTQFDT